MSCRSDRLRLLPGLRWRDVARAVDGAVRDAAVARAESVAATDGAHRAAARIGPQHDLESALTARSSTLTLTHDG